MREVPAARMRPRPSWPWPGSASGRRSTADLGDWSLSAGVAMDGGNGRAAEVALGRDAQKLYLAYQVHERRPMQNGGADWQTLFATGDCVDLMLATDLKADPNRRSAAPGDLRLLFTLFQGRPVAVLYRPVVPAPRRRSPSPTSISTR